MHACTVVTKQLHAISCMLAVQGCIVLNVCTCAVHCHAGDSLEPPLRARHSTSDSGVMNLAHQNQDPIAHHAAAMRPHRVTMHCAIPDPTANQVPTNPTTGQPLTLARRFAQEHGDGSSSKLNKQRSQSHCGGGEFGTLVGALRQKASQKPSGSGTLSRPVSAVRPSQAGKGAQARPVSAFRAPQAGKGAQSRPVSAVSKGSLAGGLQTKRQVWFFVPSALRCDLMHSSALAWCQQHSIHSIRALHCLVFWHVCTGFATKLCMYACMPPAYTR